jgi:hypothetical protein
MRILRRGVFCRVALALVAAALSLISSISPAGARIFLLLDEDAIDNADPGFYRLPNTGEGDRGEAFSETDVNDDRANLAMRKPLRFFKNPANIGRRIVLRSGQVGDEGFFAPKVIPNSWANTGPTRNGLRNFIGNPCGPFPHNVGPGLGRPGDDPEVLLDKIPTVTPLRASALKKLVGKNIAAVVYDSDISINYIPLNGNLQGETLGVVAFKVIEVKKAIEFSSSTLPLVTVEIQQPCRALAAQPRLYLNAPEPSSSSEPFDVTP